MAWARFCGSDAVGALSSRHDQSSSEDSETPSRWKTSRTGDASSVRSMVPGSSDPAQNEQGCKFDITQYAYSSDFIFFDTPRDDRSLFADVNIFISYVRLARHIRLLAFFIVSKESEANHVDFCGSSA